MDVRVERPRSPVLQFDDLDAISKGRDPSGVIRDADRAKCVALPIASPEVHRDGISTALRKARAYRLAALQKKLPSIHMTLLWVLAAIALYVSLRTLSR